jgi:hypothetical protein
MNKEQEKTQSLSGSELVWVDFSSCAYEVTNSTVAGGLYKYKGFPKRQYALESALPEPLAQKLSHIFPQCIVYYIPFVQDPEGFLHDIPHTLLWDERKDVYAVVIGHRGTEERSFVWLRLKPDGYVFASLLSFPETDEELKKWRVIRMPLAIAAFMIAGKRVVQEYPNSSEALAGFSAFLAKHKGAYDYLYVNSLGIYHDIVASPAQMRGEEAGPREIAMGFLSSKNASGNKSYTMIAVKEPTGNGWIIVSLVSQAAATRFRAKLSARNNNIGGIRWKQIDVPYGAMFYIDKGIVFYKVVKLLKPGRDKAGYMLDFRANKSKEYIRFPHVFRSSRKLVDFAERVNGYRHKIWMREGRGPHGQR